eukprot:3557524-Prymnesium_polylepis.1
MCSLGICDRTLSVEKRRGQRFPGLNKAVEGAGAARAFAKTVRTVTPPLLAWSTGRARDRTHT